MNKLVTFFNDSVAELRENVTWPGRNELINNSILVLIASLIFAIVIGAMDVAFEFIMKTIYSL
jgi:preprotein translocase subunit SecE